MDLYNLVVSAKLTKGGGGGDIDVDELSVSENGTYTALSGHAYSPVTVDVPNSYDVSDEGKVVSNGDLVSQTSATKTANGTYDTTLNNEVVVNVPSVTPTGNINITSMAQTDVSAYAMAQVVDADLVAGNIKKDVDILGVVGTYEGGGGGSAELIYDGTVTVNSASTSVSDLTTISYDQNKVPDDGDIILVSIKRVVPKANEYYGGEYIYVAQSNILAYPVGIKYSLKGTVPPLAVSTDMELSFVNSNNYSARGVFPRQVSQNGFSLNTCLNAAGDDILGDYSIKVYKLINIKAAFA